MAIALLAVATASGGLAKHTPTKQSRTHTTRSTFVVPASFAAGSETVSLEGCRNNGTITLPDAGGHFICPDGAYTSGNLGKGWNELDLVPFRLTTATKGADATDYNVIVAGDYSLGGHIGWDVVGDAAVNAGKSDASCSVSNDVPDQSGGSLGPGVTGGADSSIYRVLTIHQAANTTCVFDYYMRLALGAHNYNGSSLQAYVFTAADFKTGKKTVPLPVNEILSQSLRKDMTATTSQVQPWNVTKSPTPATVHFGDICSNGFSNTQPVQVTVTWTKLAPTPSGQVHLVTNVYASNPSARTITVTATDKMYSGSTQTSQVGTTTVGQPVDVPANKEVLVLTDDQVVSSSATSFNDVATAQYVDKVTQVPVSGSTQATASATVTTTTSGASATVTDTESIAGSGLTFAVASPSSGSFVAPSQGGNVTYTAGDYTVGPVNWSSGTNAITGNGSITFNKTIKLNPSQVTTGTLSDTATITPSDNGTPVSYPLGIGIDSQATSALTITKKIPNVLQGAETVTFHFHVFSGTTKVADSAITFNAGETQKTAQVTGLPQGSYTVTEDAATGWLPQDDRTVDVTGCSAGVEFDNNFAPATAFANKVTDPAGFQSGWTFTLTLPDKTTLAGTTDASGHVVWSGGGSQAPLGQEGTYTISETSQAGWTETGAADAGGTGTVTGGSGPTATCSFTVNYTADSGKTYGCTITNRSRGHVRVVKTFEGAALTGTESFAFQLRDGASAAAAGTIVESGTANVANNGTITFATDLLPGHTYALCEALQAHIDSSLSASLASYHPNGDAGYVCVDFSFTPAATATDPAATFNVDNTPVPASAQVKKVTDPAGFESGWVMTLTGPGTPVGGEKVTTTGAGFIGFTTQLQDGGSYTITETTKAGWTQQSASTECSFTVHYPADAGRTFSCTISNQSRGHIIIRKVTVPSGSAQSFSFATTGTGYTGFSLSDGQNNNQTVVSPGSYSVAETEPAGWKLTGIVCTDTSTGATTDLSAKKVDISLPAGGTVDCTFTNTKLATLVVKKVTIPAGSSTLFTFTPTGFNGGSTFQLSGANGSNQSTFSGLDPGSGYAVSEGALAGWDLTGASCDGTGNTPASITLPAGGTVTCTFTNTQRGSITVKKVTDPAGGAGFTFTGDVAGTLADQGTVTTANLVPGTYTSVEGAAAGWTLQSITCDDGSSATASTGDTTTRTATFKLDPGEHVTCTFVNQSRGHVRVIKTLNNGPLGAQSFTFQLRTGASTNANGTVLDTLVASSGNNGTITFSGASDALVPGQTYQLCELLVVGFGPNFPSGFGPFNPNGDPNYYCFNFSISVDDVAANGSAVTVTFNVDNAHSFTKALTIGYWKNHAAADAKKSNGKQQDDLGKYLPGITLGTITFPTPSTTAAETQAIAILNKSTLNGKKQASDPLFNMAAQLLAYFLNQNDQAGTCQAASDAASAGQALLVKYSWNGSAPPYTPALSAADAASANQYADTLDQYNNNNLC